MNVSSTSFAASVQPQRPTAQSMLQKGDTDGSRSLSLSEFKELGKNLPKGGSSMPVGAPDATKIFGKLDADGNGELTAAELSQVPRGMDGSAETASDNAFSASSADNSGLGIKTLLSLLQSSRTSDKADDTSNASGTSSLSKVVSALTEYLKTAGQDSDASKLSVSA